MSLDTPLAPRARQASWSTGPATGAAGSPARLDWTTKLDAVYYPETPGTERIGCPMPDNDKQPDASPYQQYVGMVGEPRISPPLEADGLRRFVQAIMDPDPVYYDPAAAAQSQPGRIVAPPLYPVHSFRRPLGTPDPLQAVADDPDHDGIGPSSGTSNGLPPIPSPYKRLLNGGNEVEFFRCLAVGERVVAKPRYKSIELKHTRNGEMLVVVIETRWETEAGELLMINRQTSLRR
jgi:hypothetical protein